MWQHLPVHPDLAYTRRGTPGAPPLVLLHGIGHRRQAWDPVIEELARDYDVIAPDLSGFGESPAFAGGIRYSMDNACDHLLTQFERWGVTKPHVAGNSLGGAIALELGARGLVASATALSPAGFFGPINRFQALLPLFLMRLSAMVTPKRLLQRLAAGFLRCGDGFFNPRCFFCPGFQSGLIHIAHTLHQPFCIHFAHGCRNKQAFRFQIGAVSVGGTGQGMFQPAFQGG